MYRLKVLVGPKTGESIELTEGQNSIGRQPENQIVVDSGKVSRKHCVLVVNNGQVLLKDQGSASGTFVNGVLTREARLNPGDKIKVGDCIFSLRKGDREPLKLAWSGGPQNALALPGQAQLPGAVSSGQSFELGNGLGTGAASGRPPSDLKDRLMWTFDQKVMPTFYGFLLRHQWRSLIVVLIALLVASNLLISVNPLLDAAHDLVVREVKRRASFMAKNIAEKNTPILASRNETKADIGVAAGENDVRTTVLVDLDSRIIAPSTKLNNLFVAGKEAVLAKKISPQFRTGGRETGTVVVQDDLVIAVEPVKVFVPELGKNVVVAMAVVSIDAAQATLNAGEVSTAYSQVLIFTGAVALLLFLVIYRLTLKPLQVLNEDIDRVLKGEMSEVTHEFKWEELNQLWEVVNTALRRIPRSGGQAGDLATSSSTGEEFTTALRSVAQSAGIPMAVFDHDRRVTHLNPHFEEVTGIRLDQVMGQGIGSGARNQAVPDLCNDLMDQAHIGSEGVSKDFDFGGAPYHLQMTAFGPQGSQPKAWLLVLKKGGES